MRKLIIGPSLPRTHSRRDVRQTLKARGVANWYRFINKKRLGRYSEAQFNAIFNTVERLRKQGLNITDLRVPAPEFMRLRDFVDVPEYCVKGSTLDLRNLRNLSPIGAEECPVPVTPAVNDLLTDLLQVHEFAAESFVRLESKKKPPTLDEVFQLIREVINRLSFKNVLVFMPLEEGPPLEVCWARKFVSTRWTDTSVDEYQPGKGGGASKYDPEQGGALPTSTLKSVIEGPEEFYYVDLFSLPSFNDQGLVADRASLISDLHSSVGPGGLLFLKVRLPRLKKLIGLVQIHNRVAKNQISVSETFLPEDEKEKTLTIFMLQMIFARAALAIEIAETQNGDVV